VSHRRSIQECLLPKVDERLEHIVGMDLRALGGIVEFDGPSPQKRTYHLWDVVREVGDDVF